MSQRLGIERSLLLIAISLFASTTLAAGSDFDPRTFGAKADGQTVDTKAIQAAVDACAQAGGGTVRLSGGVFLSGTVVLKSNVAFIVEAGATLLGSRNIDDYPSITPEIIYLYRDRFTKALIYAEKAENITLSGRGVINGQGEHFPYVKTGGDGLRPYLIRFSQCKNLRVRDLTLLNSARWLSHYLACENVTIEGVTIHSRIRENRDGMDIDSCNKVRIANCDVYAGDDAIVLKATAMQPCRHVTVTNCTLSSQASALKLGTESNGGFEDIDFNNCSIYDTQGDGIDVEMVDGGICERVNVSNITMTDVRVPICVRLGNRARPIPTLPEPGMGQMRNVIITNVQATGAGDIGCSITGIPDHRVENVTVANVRIRFAGGGTSADMNRTIPEREAGYPAGRMFGKLSAYGFYCRHAKGLRLENIDVCYEANEARPAFVLDDVQDARLVACRAQVSPDTPWLVWLNNVDRANLTGWCPDSMKTFVRVDGSASRRILLGQNDLAGVQNAVEQASDVPPQAVQSFNTLNKP
jgi:hypothetical protein